MHVYDLIQDRNGYIWFGTNAGVSRFDGYHFENFSTKDGLANNDVFRLMEDSQGRIWFCSIQNLSYYENGAFYSLSSDNKKVYNYVLSMMETKDGVLYLINAVAGWMVWEAAGATALGYWAMAVYIIGLMLNAGWSVIFFGMKLMRMALFEAILLWVAVALQAIVFYQIVPLAGLMILPYLLWVSVAVFLNLTIWRLNPDASRDSLKASST